MIRILLSVLFVLVSMGPWQRAMADTYPSKHVRVIVGASEREARPRCQLYATFLQRHLP